MSVVENQTSMTSTDRSCSGSTTLVPSLIQSEFAKFTTLPKIRGRIQYKSIMGRYIRNIRNTFSLQPDTEESPEYYLVRVAPLSDAGNNNFFGSYSMPIGFRTGVYSFNGHRIARYLQDAVGAIESEEAANEMANGLASALNESSTTSLIPIQGPLVIGCVVDRATGLIVGYGVGRYQPHPVVNRNGEYSGQAWHREVRGFSFDDYDDSSNIVARFITGIMLRLNNNNQ